MIDVDDVLTDFNGAFLSLCHELFGTPKALQIALWEFHKSVPGLTYEMEEVVWKKIKDTENFYETLPVYAPQEDLLLLREIVEKGLHDIFFITSRFPTKGKTVQEQTMAWIERHVGIKPKVFVTPRKGMLCRELQIEVALDDAPHHIEDLTNHGIRTVVMDWPYNRHLTGLPRVKTISQFIKLIG